jgi:hypothetical protein
MVNGTGGSTWACCRGRVNATGVRARDFPITVEKLLPYLPVEATT